MNVISKKKQGIIAIICAIAMIVTSLTIYNPREAKADTDYSTLEFTRVTEPMDSSYAYCITDNTLVDFARLNFYGTYYMQIVGSGNSKMKEAKITIDGTVQTDTTIAFDRADYITGFNISQLSDKAYHEIKLEGEGGNITIILRKGNVNGETEESTELQKPAAPTGLVANINDLKTNYTIAFANVATATSYKFYLDGKLVKDITNGGVVTIEELKLEEGKTYTFGVSAVNAAGESDISTVSVTVPSKETETSTGSTEETTEAFDPSTITEWTAVKGSTTMSYYIANDAAGKVSVQPEMHGDNLYAAFKIAAKFKSVVLNDESITPRDGADVEIAKTSFKEGYNKLVVTNFYGNESVTIYFKVEKEEETTTKPYKDGEVLVNETNVTKEVPAYTGGDYWQSEYNNTGIRYVQGKKYVAEVVVSSTAAKAIKLVFQRVNIWDSVDANQGYEAEIAAGNKVKITYVFEATQKTDNGNFDIYLGSVADATTLVFESKKLTTYNEVPAGVQTGVEVVPAPATYTVTVDGKKETVQEGTAITAPADGQGYYDVNKKVAYAPGTSITVESDMTLKSIDLHVAMASGASIRLAAPTGLRFQTIITSNGNLSETELNDILDQNKKIVNTGTLITAYNLFTSNANKLEKDSDYANLDIANSGWYKNEIGKFCGSIIKIKKENYGRKFIAVGYATINYENGEPKTVYASVTENNAKSIKYIAEKIIDADEYKNYTDAQKAVINAYIDGKEISE